MKRSIIIAVGMLVLAGGTGCGDEQGSYVQGVYKISGWTINQGSCGVVGDELDNRPQMLYVKFSQAPSPKMVASVCADPADCGRQLRSLSTSPFAWTLKPDGENTWKGKIVDSYPLNQESCVGNQVDLYATTSEDGQIRIEVRHFDEAEFAKSSCREADQNGAEPEICMGGYCDASDARLATKDSPCGTYEVILGQDYEEIISNTPAGQENSVASSGPKNLK